MSPFKIISDALPWLRREQMLARADCYDKIAWIAEALSRQYDFPQEIAVQIVTGAVTCWTTEQFETVDRISELSRQAAACLKVAPPPLYGWHTVH